MIDWMPAFVDEIKTAASQGRLTVPKSRSGRRPMSVDTLLRKEKDGTLYKASEYQEVDPRNPTVKQTVRFSKGDVPSRDDIPGRTNTEFRLDMAGTKPAGRDLAPEGFNR